MHKKVIAIIDDEIEMEDLYLLMFEPLLETKKVKLNFFSNGLSFLNWFKSNRPDVLLCDINLPTMNGDELIEEIRRIERTSKTPRINISFVSADEPESYLMAMKRYQIRRYITKPISIRQTLQEIQADLGFVAQ